MSVARPSDTVFRSKSEHTGPVTVLSGVTVKELSHADLLQRSGMKPEENVSPDIAWQHEPTSRACHG